MNLEGLVSDIYVAHICWRSLPFFTSNKPSGESDVENFLHRWRDGSREVTALGVRRDGEKWEEFLFWTKCSTGTGEVNGHEVTQHVCVGRTYMGQKVMKIVKLTMGNLWKMHKFFLKSKTGENERKSHKNLWMWTLQSMRIRWTDNLWSGHAIKIAPLGLKNMLNFNNTQLKRKIIFQAPFLGSGFLVNFPGHNESICVFLHFTLSFLGLQGYSGKLWHKETDWDWFTYWL